MGHGTGAKTSLTLFASIFVLGVSHNMWAKRAACRRSAALFLLFCTGLLKCFFYGGETADMTWAMNSVSAGSQ